MPARPARGTLGAPLLALVLVTMAATGRRFGRRAALRGAASAGLALTTASALRAPPGIRRAAAFAAVTTGAAMEAPRAGAALGALAAGTWGLRSARSERGVAAGAVAGAAVALATRKSWPVAPHEPAELFRGYKRVEQPPSPDGAGLTVVVNAGAGPAIAGSPAEALRAALPAARVVEVPADGDLIHALNDAAAASRALGAAGGDGTLNAAADVALRADKPLMIVPAGTLNHLARDLGLIGVDDAVDAVRSGSTVAVDVGVIDGRPFLNTASFGGYVDLVDAREQLQARIGKWPAALVALVRVLRRAEPVAVEIDGRRRTVWMAFIGNCRYRPSGFAPSWRERLDDGLLDVRLVDASSPWSRTRLVAAVLTGRLGRSRVYEQFRARKLRIRGLNGPMRLARDGETFDGSTEFTVEKRPRALSLYVPSRQ